LFNQAMAGDHSDDLVSDYRLAPTYRARLVGGLLVGLAVLLFVATALVAVGLPADLVVVLAVLGVAGVLTAGYLLTRRVPVVRLGPAGYRIRLIRGVGVAAAGWTEVGEAVTALPGGQPVVVLKLRDGRTTTIPVAALAADREEFVRDLRAHLQRGQGLRPL
jgi:uncharacterized membrane protein